VIELPDVLITGLVHVSSLMDDFYLFEPAQRRLIGRRSRKRFDVGDEVRVFVVRVDQFKRQVDFAIASETPTKAGRSKAQPRIASSSDRNRRRG
jgi:ribonuclease R